MYENIICESSHKHMLIPRKELLRKLKMLGAIVTLSSLAVTSFSGCDVIKRGVEELQKTTENSYVQEIEETKASVEDSTMSTEDYVEETQEISHTNFIEEIMQEGKINSERLKPLTDKEYNELLESLNIILQEKNFPEEANSLIIDIFEALCKNYHTWKDLYINMPTTKEYIENNLINSIKEISKFEVVDIQSNEGQKRINNGDALGFTTAAARGKLNVRMIVNKKENATEQEREEDIELTAHEILGHCKHKGMFTRVNNELYLLLVEGSATFNQKFVNKYSTESYGRWIASNEDESLTIQYNKSNGIGYLSYLNAYEKLVFLLGYDVINDMEDGKISFSEIEKKLIEYYGKENGEKFVETMKKWFLEYEENWKGDEVYKLCVDFENTFMEMVEYNIGCIDNEELLNMYKNMYNQYVERNMPTVRNQNYEDVTSQIFDYYHIYNKFEERQEEISNKNSNKKIDEEPTI